MFWLIDGAQGYIVFNMVKKCRQASLTPSGPRSAAMAAATANFGGSTLAGLTGIVTPARRRTPPVRGGTLQTAFGQQ